MVRVGVGVVVVVLVLLLVIVVRVVGLVTELVIEPALLAELGGGDGPERLDEAI